MLSPITIGHSTEQHETEHGASLAVHNYDIVLVASKLGTNSNCNTQMSCVMRKPTFWFPTWSNTNQAVQLQKMDRGLKSGIKKVGGLYNLCSENKDADKLRGYCENDLRLCLRICKTLVFS